MDCTKATTEILCFAQNDDGLGLYGVHGLTAVDGFGERLVDEFAHLLGRDEVLSGRVLRRAAAGDVGGTGRGYNEIGRAHV